MSVFQKKLGFGVFLVHPTVQSVLLSSSVKRCFASRMQNFYSDFLICRYFSAFFRVFSFVMKFFICSNFTRKEKNTEHQKWPEIGKKQDNKPFFAQRVNKALNKGRSPTQQLKVSSHSGPYFLVFYLYFNNKNYFVSF